MSPFRLGLAVVLVAASAAVWVSPASAAKKGPPSCAAISFRPVSGTPNDGIMDAGLYRSRFGEIVLKAEIKGGMAHSYYLEVGGKRLDPLKGALPASVNSCLNSKHVKTPAPMAGDTCVGERFRVVIDHTGKQEFIILYGLKGDTWQQCSASQL